MANETHKLYRAKAVDAGLDTAGGAWVVVCETHGAVVNVETRAAARTITASDFCEGAADTDEPVDAGQTFAYAEDGTRELVDVAPAVVDAVAEADALRILTGSTSVTVRHERRDESGALVVVSTATSAAPVVPDEKIVASYTRQGYSHATALRFARRH